MNLITKIKEGYAKTVAGMLGLAVAALVVAATPMSTYAASGQTLSSGESITAGDSTWYSFDYTGDGSQIEIWMDSETDNTNVNFAVWTPDELNTDDSNAVGRGSANEYKGGDTYWTGEFNQVGTYYVQVYNDSGSASGYTLTIAGDGVTLADTAGSDSDTTTDDTATVAATITETAADSTTSSLLSGSSVETAKAVTDGWTSIAPGESVWYVMSYSGDNAKMEAWLETDNSAVNFAVWTPERLAADADPVGEGSASDYTPGDSYWTGDSAMGGLYYIQVYNDSAATYNYDLHLTVGE